MNNLISLSEINRSTGNHEDFGCRCLYCKSMQAKQALINRIYPRNDAQERLSLTQLVPGRSYELGCGDLTIGKDEGNQIILCNDIQVSRHHASISMDNGQLFIHDLGSRQGTQVNGQYVIGREVLTRDDIVKIGRTIFTVG